MESQMRQTPQIIDSSSRESMRPIIHNDNSNTNTIYGSGDILNLHHITNYLFGTTTTGEKSGVQAKIATALRTRYVPRAVYNAHLSSGCMVGTRVDIIRMIENWIENPDDSPILWLTGMAGMGKTSIVWTICSHADTNINVVFGGSFFCSRSTGSIAQRDILCVVPTLAQLMAFQSVEFGKALAEELARDPGVLEKQIGVQIERLLYKPLLALKDSRVPILFVIDALDECGGVTATNGTTDDAETHRIVSEMLEALVTFSHYEAKLPVKFLVTSRPETHIRDTAVLNSAFSSVLRLHTISKSQVTADIHLYITASLSTNVRLRDQITLEEAHRLALLCDGLFIFAATALRYILGAGIDAAALRFDTLLNTARDGLGTRAAAPLDYMYDLILKESLETEEPERNSLSAIRYLLASLLCSSMTLSVSALADLLDQPKHHVRGHLSRLHAVVHVPDDNGEPGLHTLHASFGDYLFKRAPTNIRISESLGHEILARGCLRRMTRIDLCFNVSRSHSSFEANHPSMGNQIATSLVYACLHWASHIKACSNAAAFDVLIGKYFVPKFLFWLEVLSILGKVGAASGVLRLARSNAQRDSISRFLHDACSFVASSREAIERSASHIYLSALPFAGRDSLVYRIFAPLCAGLVSVEVLGIDCHGDRLAMTLTGHNDSVLSVVYSPDSRLLVSASLDGTIRTWNTRSGEEVIKPLQSCGRAVYSVAFAPSGESLACGTYDGVYIWTGLAGHPTALRLSGHSSSVKSVVFSSDGSIIASGSADRTIRLWKIDTGEQVAILRGHTKGINAVDFCPSSHILASCSDDETIGLWNFRTGESLGFILCNQNLVLDVRFSPDGRWLVSGSLNSSIQIRECQTWDIVTELRGHLDNIRSVHFSPDGRSLVSASADKSVRLWALQQTTGEPSCTVLLGHSDSVCSAILSPDSLQIASASNDRTIRIWDAVNGQGSAHPLPGHSSAVLSVAVSPDGCLIVSGSKDHSVRVWNIRTGEPRFPLLLGHTDEVLSVSVSSDGRLIASASKDCTIRLWNAHTGEAIGEPLRGHEGAVTAVTISPDVQSFGSGSWDRTVRMWDVATGRSAIMMFDDRANTVTFSQDGRLFAAGGSSGLIHLWQTATGQLLRQILHADFSVAESVAFSSAGLHIVSVGYPKICVWDITTGEQILALDSPTDWVYSAVFSPDGQFICMGSISCSVILWNLATGSTIVLRGHGGAVRSVEFTPCGQSIVSCADDGTIRVWDFQAACAQPLYDTSDLFARLTSTGLKDGWILGPLGELLLWVPEEYRAFLHVPPCKTLIGNRCIFFGIGPTDLCHGDSWTKCWRNDI